MFIKAIEDEQMNGVYNATGSYPVTNRELTKAIGKILNRPIILPFIPEFVLRMILGEMAAYVLKGSKVSSEKIQRAGFQFKFTNLEEALRSLLG
jgi:NAD dependent epimerase/dehydratase family enzyme